MCEKNAKCWGRERMMGGAGLTSAEKDGRLKREREGDEKFCIIIYLFLLMRQYHIRVWVNESKGLGVNAATL
jgi:hypothetical protein